MPQVRAVLTFQFKTILIVYFLANIVLNQSHVFHLKKLIKPELNVQIFQLFFNFRNRDLNPHAYCILIFFVPMH